MNDKISETGEERGARQNGAQTAYPEKPDERPTGNKTVKVGAAIAAAVACAAIAGACAFAGLGANQQKPAPLPAPPSSQASGSAQTVQISDDSKSAQAPSASAPADASPSSAATAGAEPRAGAPVTMTVHAPGWQPGTSTPFIAHVHGQNRAGDPVSLYLALPAGATQTSVPAGNYTIEWISAVNDDGSVYKTPQAQSLILPEDGGANTARFEHIAARDTTAQQVDGVVGQLIAAVASATSGELVSDGGKMVGRAFSNAAANPEKKKAESGSEEGAQAGPETQAFSQKPENQQTAQPAGEPKAQADAQENEKRQTGQPAARPKVETVVKTVETEEKASGSSATKTWVEETGHYITVDGELQWVVDVPGHWE